MWCRRTFFQSNWDMRRCEGFAIMRKAQKQEILDFIDGLHQAHEEIREALRQKQYIIVQNMLSECQDFAVTLGETIERLEGEGCITVSYVEEYCEALFHVFEQINSEQCNGNRIIKILKKQLLNVENSVKNDISLKKEIVFFPYKASMWDSMESVYFAAKEDTECDVYCVPIPYFDLNPDHSFAKMHYEGNEYSEDIEITDWQSYNLEERKPDVIYIHNPYDNWNLVTSVHPRYYSSNLKKYTDALVYIPYYSTSGKMGEAQSLCPAYVYADYIVIQSPSFRRYFDNSIPDSKFVPFGSPKFDRVIRKCKNPPIPPVEWQEKMRGKKVYFYNTSIAGMLADTEAFLKKMEYVFSNFQGREDACLLWRPHPLLEATFDSMRPRYRSVYDALKQAFADCDFGIYDDTADVTNSIALSDAYIGDEGSSIVALFGIAGKPIFVLNNKIHSAPKDDSWRGELDFTLNGLEQDRFIITRNNKLYCSKAFEYDYKYKCDLSKYAYETTYGGVCEINGKLYVYPRNARDILEIGSEGVEQRISLKNLPQKDKKAFCGAGKCDKYLLLIPFGYPAIVRYDTDSGEVEYCFENIDIFVKKNEDGQIIVGGAWLYSDALYIASPTDNFMFRLDIKSLNSEVIKLPEQNSFRCSSILEHNGKFWMFPRKGKKIICWDLDTGETKEFSKFPSDFQCIHPISGYICDENPFCGFAIYGDEIYLSPFWANMYIKINAITGELSKWKIPFEDDEGKEYFYTIAKSYVFNSSSNDNSDFIKVFSPPQRKLYEVNTVTNEYREIEIKFDINELKRNEPGFCVDSERIRYCCRENAFNSLKCFLDGKITGNQFDASRQREEYMQVVTNVDGNCGKKLHEFISKL